MSWVSLHVVHHGDLDELLVAGVRPVVAELRRRGLVDAFFFLRYWDGGPHVRLRLRTDAPVAARTRATAELRRHLAEHPAPDADLTDYPRYAAELARLEGVPDHLRQPLPNNTVHAIDYRPETARYGTGAALATVERHFAESSRIALGLIAAGTTRDQRHTTAVAALLLTALAHGGAPGRAADAATGAISATNLTFAAREHTEFDERYQHARAGLGALAARVAEIAAGTSALPASGALSAWWRTIGTVPGWPVADLCAHLLCNRLGLGLPDERYARYLAARTAGELVPR